MAKKSDKKGIASKKVAKKAVQTSSGNKHGLSASKDGLVSKDFLKSVDSKKGKGGKNPIKLFSAGDLFNHKDLIGNIFLADAFERVSKNRYGKVFLAQNKVQQKVTHQIIKDQDLMGLMRSDVAMFAFDGIELDSGTVVEFMAAKMLDVPSVVYRSDFRGGSGEEAIDEESNRWNLMVSFYPRTKVIYFNAMLEY